jgi:outer membrane receptor protein involved in Fe transport
MIAALLVAAVTISGVVLDSSGGVLPGATVVVRGAGNGEQRTVTGSDGRFAIPIAGTGEVTLVVHADGFEEKQERVPLGSGDSVALTIELTPAALLEELTVTATRSEQRLRDVAASVNILSSAEIKQSPAVVADDILRQLPTFSLFRRTSSLSSHPTSQGVSLRGIGPSGVSRTLVLLDGVPFNDPFGGWVYWSRVPLESADRIEVVDTSSSSLYGNYAMGGVINIVTSAPARRTFEIRPQYGSRNSPKVDGFASDVWGKVGVVADGSAFGTDGFPIVAPAERGRVDNNANVRFGTANVKVEYNPSARVGVFARGGYFRENRDNGKASTIDGTEEANSTRWTAGSGGARLLLPDESSLQATVFGDSERFHSNFLAVPAANPPRSIGRMTLNQMVPVSGAGVALQWTKAASAKQLLTAGMDWRRVDGDSNEDGLDAATGTRVTLRRISGGTQQMLGAFVQDMFSPHDRVEVTLSVRADRWRNYDAHSLETNVPSGTPTANNNPALPEREDTVASPRAAVIYHVNDKVSAWGDLGWGFRAPTLNELYRQFRVGTVLTLANNQLGPERLVGGDLGITIAPTRRFTWRTTWFDNRIRNPVSNVTLTTVGANVTQQRQNLGRTGVWGVQTDAEYRPATFWRLSGGYLYDDATVREFAANRTLVGNTLPQVPRHRASVQASYANPRYATIAVAVQLVGRQFDDDQNTRKVPGYTTPGLPRYALVDVRIARAVGRNFEVFAGAQNVFDQEYFVGTLPTTIGSPRLVTAGFRLRVGGR